MSGTSSVLELVRRLSTTFVSFASVLSSTAIGLERCASIRWPMLHAAHLTIGRTLTVIAAIWAVSAAVASIPPAVGWDVAFDYDSVDDRCCQMSSSSSSDSDVVTIFVTTGLLRAPDMMHETSMASVNSLFYGVDGLIPLPIPNMKSQLPY